LYEWLLWIVWFIVLILLAEYTLGSRREMEWQAATLSSALFLIVLLGGVITGVIRRIEAQDQDKYH
jgi:4-hydroxybenzoate polyprenyltransferase